MKELYICIFEKFNLSLQEVHLFDYNKQDEVITSKLQKAFSYYRAQSRDDRIMFMQFCRNLQRIGEEHGYALNKQKLALERSSAPRPFVFINVYNLNVMVVQNKREQLYSFICVQNASERGALDEYAGILRQSYGVDMDKGRCAFFGNIKSRAQSKTTGDCGVFFYPLTLGEFKILETSREDTLFKNINDPMLVLGDQYAWVSPFVPSINLYIQEVKALMTRKKSESAPAMISEEPGAPVDDAEKKLMVDRLKEFDKSLDDILRKYNLLD